MSKKTDKNNEIEITSNDFNLGGIDGDSATLFLDGTAGIVAADPNSIKYIPGPNIIQKLEKIDQRLARIEQSLEKPKTKVPKFG